MKKLILLLFISLVFACDDQLLMPKSDLVLSNVFGNAKIVSTLSIDYEIGGELINKFYNQQGYVTSIHTYLLPKKTTRQDYLNLIKSGDGPYMTESITYKTEIVDGREVFSGRKDISVVDIDGEAVRYIYYKYDKNGNLIEKIYKSNSEFTLERLIKRKIIYEYDINDNLIEKIIYSTDSNDNLGMVKRFTYYFDEFKNKIEENFFDSNDKLFFKIKYKNDKLGNPTKEIFYGADGKKVSEYQYYYYNSKASKSVILPFKFDKYNNWNQSISSKSNTLTERIIIYY